MSGFILLSCRKRGEGEPLNSSLQQYLAHSTLALEEPGDECGPWQKNFLTAAALWAQSLCDPVLTELGPFCYLLILIHLMGKNYPQSCREWELEKDFCLPCVEEQVSCLAFPSGQWSSCHFHIAAGVWLKTGLCLQSFVTLICWDLLAGVAGKAQFGKWLETDGERWGFFPEFLWGSRLQSWTLRESLGGF